MNEMYLKTEAIARTGVNWQDPLAQFICDLGASAVAEVARHLRTPVDAELLGLGTLRRALFEFYLPYRALDPFLRNRWLQEGQIHWSDTGLARHQRTEAETFLRRHISMFWPASLPIDLVDLGAGDGRMTVAVIDGIREGGASIAGVRLIDRNMPALRLAESRVAVALSESPVRSAVCDFRATEFLTELGGSTLVFASAALHELPIGDRESLLRRLAERVHGVALVELSQNNDVAGPVESRFALQVGRFYSKLIADAYQTLNPSDYWPVIGVFLLGELLQIWRNDYRSRGNFHLTGKSWDDVLAQAGFNVCATTATSFAGLKTSYRLAISCAI